MPSDAHPTPEDRRPVSFPQWKAELAGAGLHPEIVTEYRRAILSFLHHCKVLHAGASVIVARQYFAHLAAQGRSAAEIEAEKVALRWWFRMAKAAARGDGAVQWKEPQSRPEAAITGRETRATTEPELLRNPATPERHGREVQPYKSSGAESEVLRNPATVGRPTEPPRAAQDLGGADWERDLIKASRERNFLWRTEQTYREWAARFAAFLRPRSPYAANAEDVAAFLSQLAVEKRASPSTQKQALNALVFLLQEALHRELGKIDFHRAAAKRHVPTVLSLDECRRLFAQLNGTPRLMAELMYGAGLRLMELLRLRIHHLDLERRQLRVLAGKGDKDRVTMLPESLIAALTEQVGRLRPLFAQDRAENLPGVWLPEGLARKYPNAGTSWEWQWLFPSRETSFDPVGGIRRRHHVTDTAVQKFVRRAAVRPDSTSG